MSLSSIVAFSVSKRDLFSYLKTPWLASCLCFSFGFSFLEAQFNQGYRGGEHEPEGTPAGAPLWLVSCRAIGTHQHQAAICASGASAVLQLPEEA
jgi:hypothetical protein